MLNLGLLVLLERLVENASLRGALEVVRAVGFARGGGQEPAGATCGWNARFSQQYQRYEVEMG